MEWEDYKKRFYSASRKAGFSKEDQQKCLIYAKNIFSKKHPIIYDQSHLSLLVGFDLEYLLKVTNSQKHFYRKFKIAKKNGTEREISEPLPNLKEIQRWILEEILYKSVTSNYAKAYKTGFSIKDNARFHKNQKYVITLDIKNFFGSIKWGVIYKYFSGIGYINSVAIMLTNICTLEDTLPQGAPTSAALSNIISFPIDNKIAEYSKEHKLRYTRYADDITLSGDASPGNVIEFVTNLLKKYDFIVNQSKTRVLKQSQRQLVTGVVVNSKQLQAPASIRDELRKSIYFIEKFGIESHITHEGINKANYIHHLLGVANYIKFLNPKDKDAIKALEVLKPHLI